MCGICGRWCENGVAFETLQLMANEIRHRGPDEDGYYVDAQIGLASRRLSIIDVDNGRQPLTNEDKTIWLVFNGEIYNFRSLREILIDRGHTFVTRTDSEVIIHLYEEYGDDFVTHLRGMFALAIWDQPRQRLVLVRDHIGQKQLYYRFRHGTFSFASEVKALLVVDPFRPRMNRWSMHHLISIRCIPEDETLFEGILKLPAAHMLVFENQTIAVRRYWDLQYDQKTPGSSHDLVRGLRDLLMETVQCHMESDVAIGSLLSGGIDSSLITAMLSTLSKSRIKTFTVGVRAPDFDETPWARMVAEKYDTEHHELMVEPNVVATLPDMVWHMEEPVDPFAFGVYSVAQLASKYVKVLLGGDGGDEMFAGYDRYLGNGLVDLFRLIPPVMRHRVVEPIISRLPDNFSYNNRVQKLRWLTAMSDCPTGERYAASARYLRFRPEHMEQLYSSSLFHQLGGSNPNAALTHFFNAENASVALDKMLFTDVKTRLAEHLLVVVDRMTMAHSVEARSPYVDHHVAEYVARLPASLKLKGSRLKYALREVAKEFLPAALIDRPKQGFSFPLAYWFRSDLEPLTRSLFKSSVLVEEGLFRREAMIQLLDDHVEKREDHNYRLWILLNLELWHRMFVGGQTAEDLSEGLVESTSESKLYVA